MIQPKQYKAMTINDPNDPFMGRKSRQVRGYYVKHVNATANPINTQEGYKAFTDKHTQHFIFTDGFSDWNMPRGLDCHEIDITTLEELPDDTL